MFIPRHPVVENQFCSYGATNTSGGVGGVICYAGSVVYLDATATNEEPIVFKMTSDQVPFGFRIDSFELHPINKHVHKCKKCGYELE